MWRNKRATAPRRQSWRRLLLGLGRQPDTDASFDSFNLVPVDWEPVHIIRLINTSIEKTIHLLIACLAFVSLEDLQAFDWLGSTQQWHFQLQRPILSHGRPTGCVSSSKLIRPCLNSWRQIHCRWTYGMDHQLAHQTFEAWTARLEQPPRMS